MDARIAGPTRRRPVRRVVLASLAVVFVLLLADAIWAASTAASSLRKAETGLRQGGDALLDGRVPDARNAFEAAQTAADRARSALDHPSVRIAAALPWLGDSVEAARRVTRSAEAAAEGGGHLVSAADAVGWNGDSIPGFAPGGRIDAGLFRSAEDDVDAASAAFSLAVEELAPVDPSGLPRVVGDPLSDAKREIGDRAEQVRTAASLVHLLPGFLGADEPRTYLLVTLSASDPRAAGGYPGVFGVLRVDGSRIRLSPLRPTSTIPEVPALSAPDAVRRAWGPYGSLTSFWDTTYTLDFPTAAGLMTGIWEAGGGRRIDGVIAGDIALSAALLAGTGPVKSPTWPQPITAGNVEGIVGADVYRTTDQAKSDAWQVGIGQALWGRFFTQPWPVRATADAIAGAVDDRHLQVWSRDPDEQATLADLGATGAPTMPGDGTPLVAFNGFTANRAGYFATYDVTSKRQGDEVTSEIVITNDAPDGPPSILLGLSRGDVGGGPLGTFGVDVNIYLPPDAAAVQVRVDGEREVPFTFEDAGHRVVSSSVLVPPEGGRVRVNVTYRMA
jgi:hypothetical protein